MFEGVKEYFLSMQVKYMLKTHYKDLGLDIRKIEYMTTRELCDTLKESLDNQLSEIKTLKFEKELTHKTLKYQDDKVIELMNQVQDLCDKLHAKNAYIQYLKGNVKEDVLINEQGELDKLFDKHIQNLLHCNNEDEIRKEVTSQLLRNKAIKQKFSKFEADINKNNIELLR